MSQSVQESTCVAQDDVAPERSEQRLIVQALIDRARSAPVASKAPWLLAPLSGLLHWGSFTPLDWGWLAWFSLVPLLCLIRSPRPLRSSLRAAWVGGLLCWLATLQWMRLGDPTMYPAWGALAFYISLYFPVFLLVTRIAVHRLNVPLVVAAPIVWVGLEFARAHLMTGFAWYLLGHSQYRWTAITQISDLVGGYGVSFLVMAVNAALASLIPVPWLKRLDVVPAELNDAEQSRLLGTSRGRMWAVAGVLALFAASWGYGVVRSSTSFEAGPRVGLLQGSFPSAVNRDPNQDEQIFSTYRMLNGLAVRHQAELILWPESMMPYVMLQAREGRSDQELAELHPLIPAERWKDQTVQKVLSTMSEESRASLIVGASTYVDVDGRAKRYNSAVFVQASGIQGRYDKIHRVPFGEYTPLKDSLPFLNSLTPYAEVTGLDAGKTVGVFRHKQARLLPLICFEDTVPHLVRQSVRVSRSQEAGEGDVDCLVNLTNDGWFHGSSEHDQHLITASFRCIETRVPMVRAVNTGISAIIDGNGQLRDPDILLDLDRAKAHKPYERETLADPETGKLPKLCTMVQVGQIPLDPRESLYVRWGDWFGMSCLGAALFALLYGMIVGREMRKAALTAA
jgi:apolipoprotein N-acyltransferase